MYVFPCATRTLSGSTLAPVSTCVPGVRPLLLFLFSFLSLSLFRLSSFPSFSSLAAHTPCVLSRCTEDLTALLSSQQASELRDRCAKFKVRIPEKSSLTSRPKLRSASSLLLAITLSPRFPPMNRKSMTHQFLQIKSVNKASRRVIDQLIPLSNRLWSEYMIMVVANPLIA